MACRPCSPDAAVFFFGSGFRRSAHPGPFGPDSTVAPARARLRASQRGRPYTPQWACFLMLHPLRGPAGVCSPRFFRSTNPEHVAADNSPDDGTGNVGRPRRSGREYRRVRHGGLWNRANPAPPRGTAPRPIGNLVPRDHSPEQDGLGGLNQSDASRQRDLMLPFSDYNCPLLPPFARSILNTISEEEEARGADP